MPRRRPSGFAIGLAAVAVGALVLRIVYVLTIGERNPDGGDPLYYHVQANLLADGHGFAEPFTWLRERRIEPSAIHPPLFTVLLSVSSFLGGTGFFAHKLVACLLGTGTVVAVGLLGRRVAGPTGGIVAAVLAAVHPNLWVIDGILMPEGAFGFAIALALLAAYRLADRPTPARAAWFGVAGAAAALVRGEALLLLPLLALPVGWRLLRRESWRAAATTVGAAAAASILVLLPWTVRNLTTFDVPVLLSVNGDEVLANSNCDITWHGDLLGFWALGCYRGDPQGDEAERGRGYRDVGLEYVRDNASRIPVVVAARVGRVWDVWRPFQNTHLSTVEGRDLRLTRAGLIAYWALLPFAAAGVVVARRRGVPLLPLLVPFALVTLTAVYAYGAVRFRVPAEISIVVLAAVAIEALASRARRRAAA